MEDNSDKLSDFIRNRLKSTESPNGDWDKPDVSIWENTKSQLLQTNKKKKRVLPFWFYGSCLAILLLSSLFYNGYLLQTKNQMLAQFEEQSQVVNQLKEQLSQSTKMQQVQHSQNQNTIEKLQLDKERLTRDNERMNSEFKQIKEQYQSLFTIQSALKNIKIYINLTERT